MAFEGFDAAMSRTRSPECRGKNRAVAEARPDRDDVSLPRGREWVRRGRSGRCGNGRSGPAERLARRPHAVRITASLRATAMVAFLEPMRLARDRPQACKSLGLADRLSSTLAASNNSPRTI